MGRRWMLVLSCDDVPAMPLPATGRQAGVDVGIVQLRHRSATGPHIDNPRWGRAAADRLTAAQQRLQRARRGSEPARQAGDRSGAAPQDRQSAQGLSSQTGPRTRRARYDLVVVEDLPIANMVRRAKPVPDPDNPGQYLANGRPGEVRA